MLIFLPKGHGDLLLSSYDALIQGQTFSLWLGFPAIIGPNLRQLLFFHYRVPTWRGNHDRRLKIQWIFPFSLSLSLSPQISQGIPLSEQLLLILLHILHQQFSCEIPSRYFLNLNSSTMLHIILSSLLSPYLLQECLLIAIYMKDTFGSIFPRLSVI